MFRITEDPSSGSLVQCLFKNYKNDSIMSVDLYKVGVMAVYSDLVHFNEHDRIILVIISQTLYKAP
jgi:hypothetical protein